MHRHARADARLDEECLRMKISLGHSRKRGVERRHNRADDDAENFLRIELGDGKQIAREDSVFVDRLIPRCGQPPIGDQIFIAKDAQHCIGIANVNRQQHQFASETSPEMTTAVFPSSRRTRRSPFGSSPSLVPT